MYGVNNILPNEEEDPYPAVHLYPGYDDDNKAYRTEEKQAKDAIEFFRDPHFDLEHNFDPDPNCKVCKKLGLVGKILH
ncbi:hypothetical protein J4409_03360 [Candidatus Woesearchaeota archaeon]|nr:hypothetical protein [Candidatus Woesearchaeota archaeon]